MRKEVMDALEHRTPSRIPIDFGGTNCSGMHASCGAQLREYYGLEKRPVKVYEPYQMLGLIEEDLKQAMAWTRKPRPGAIRSSDSRTRTGRNTALTAGRKFWYRSISM